MIQGKLRPCLVKREDVRKALFHGWGKKAMLNEFREFKDAITVGYVELEDGTIETVNPGCIQFTDNKFKEFCFDDRRDRN